MNLAKAIESGAIKIPPPPPGVADWWFIGEPISKFWTLASQNLEAAIDKIGPQLTVISQWLLKATAGAGLEILMFIVAIIIAAVLHVNSASCHHAARLIFQRISGDRGDEYADLSEYQCGWGSPDGWAARDSRQPAAGPHLQRSRSPGRQEAELCDGRRSRRLLRYGKLQQQ